MAIGKIILAVVGLCGIAYAIAQNETGGPTIAATASTPAVPSLADAEAAAPLRMPGSELSFISTLRGYVARYNEAGNEMAQGALRVQRAHTLCQQESASVEGWTGKIITLSSNSDGRGVLAVKLIDGVTLATWNNALSDFTDHTLIDPSSDVGAAAASMAVGAPVTFSGRLVSSDTDCFGEQSMTQDGAMTSPEFTFQFSKLGAYQP